MGDSTAFIQNHSKYDSPIIIHTGTNDVRREASRTTKLRLQRLEINLVHKGYRHVALSGVVFRGNDHIRRKTLDVNQELAQICKRNNWQYIDNGNIDSSCIDRDGLHLNQNGRLRLASNFKNVLKNFYIAPSMKLV